MLEYFHKRTFNEHMIIASLLGVAFTAISYLTAHLAGWDAKFSVLEFAAVITSYSCTYLANVESRMNYVIGIITTFLYSWLFYNTGLYAVALFNLYLVFSLMYGWVRWGADGSGKRPVEDFSYKSRWVGIYLLIGIGIYLLLYAINSYFKVEMGLVDVAVAVMSGVAQFMLDNKHRQTWFVWAVVNVLSIWLYFKSGLYLVTLQYAFFLVNTMMGYALWTKSMRERANG